jgi:hypothetical protein
MAQQLPAATARKRVSVWDWRKAGNDEGISIVGLQ